MKILIVSDAWHPQMNGVVRTYEHLQEELVKTGHKVKVIGPADFPVNLPMPGYSEIRLAVAPYARLTRMIQEFEPNHIHVATEGPLGMAARKYCLKSRLPFTTSYHTHFPDYIAQRIGHYAPFLHDATHTLAKKFMRWFHAPASALLVSTQSLETELREWGFKTPMFRFSRGVNMEQFFPGEKTLFHDLKRPIALYVGRIAIEKNIEDFLKMDWEGSKVLIGDGPSLPSLSEQYPDAHFLGRKTGKDLADCYRSSDLFVFPSRTDTFGIVLVEALASGLPVAAYDETGPRDIITAPFLGALDKKDLSAAARRAFQGTPEDRALHVRQNYTWANAGRQFESAISHYCIEP
ncbi:MAG: glycosyltransferase family 1 protein [Alphaproteobacteria bacterium]